MTGKRLERIAMALMVIGIISLCQPWIGLLHSWSVLVMIIGLIGFNIAAHMPGPQKRREPEHG